MKAQYGHSWIETYLVTLHRACWYLCYSSSTDADFHLAMLRYTRHQSHIFVFGDSFRAPGWKTETLTLLLFLLVYSCSGETGSSISVVLKAWDAGDAPPEWNIEQILLIFCMLKGLKRIPYYCTIDIAQCQRPNQSWKKTFCFSIHINQA